MNTDPVGEAANELAKKCEVCGNVYNKAFKVEVRGVTHVFDCFECAIQCLAPTCAYCGCRVIGHGVEADHIIYCCAHCARAAFPDKAVTMNV